MHAFDPRISSILTYPTITHWVWSRTGWLSVSNPDSFLGGAVDFAGGGAHIQHMIRVHPPFLTSGSPADLCFPQLRVPHRQASHTSLAADSADCLRRP